MQCWTSYPCWLKATFANNSLSWSHYFSATFSYSISSWSIGLILVYFKTLFMLSGLPSCPPVRCELRLMAASWGSWCGSRSSRFMMAAPQALVNGGGDPPAATLLPPSPVTTHNPQCPHFVQGSLRRETERRELSSEKYPSAGQLPDRLSVLFPQNPGGRHLNS